MGLDRDSPVDFTYLAAPISAYWSNLVGLIRGLKRFGYLLLIIIFEMGKVYLRIRETKSRRWKIKLKLGFCCKETLEFVSFMTAD